MKKVRCNHFQTTQQFLVDEAGTVIFMPCVGEKKKIHAMPSVLTIRDRVDSTSVLQEPFILRCASMDTETG